MSNLRQHLIERHDETDKDLGLMIDENRYIHPGHDEGWHLELIHNRQHTSLDWDAGHDESDTP